MLSYPWSLEGNFPMNDVSADKEVTEMASDIRRMVGCQRDAVSDIFDIIGSVFFDFSWSFPEFNPQLSQSKRMPMLTIRVRCACSGATGRDFGQLERLVSGKRFRA